MNTVESCGRRRTVEGVTGSPPWLTVVVPVWRAEPYLNRCLDSVLAGTDERVEVVAVDDASPDGSGALLDAYARRDPRVRVLHLPTNTGLGPARNAGLAQARGRYVWFVDVDDWLPDGAVTAVLDRLQRVRPDVLVVGHAEVHPDGRAVTRLPSTIVGHRNGPPGPLAERPELLRLPHSACTKIARRELLETRGLRFSEGWYEDGLFSHVLLLHAGRIDVLDRTCYCYRQRGGDGAITSSVSPRHLEVFDQYDRLWALVERDRRHWRYRPQLFRLMIDHYLVIAGHPRRLPGHLRRTFFARAAADYRRRLPAEGYPTPRGIAGLKHKLIAKDAYLSYAVLRTAWRATGPVRHVVARHVPVRRVSAGR